MMFYKIYLFIHMLTLIPYINQKLYFIPFVILCMYNLCITGDFKGVLFYLYYQTYNKSYLIIGSESYVMIYLHQSDMILPFKYYWSFSVCIISAWEMFKSVV